MYALNIPERSLFSWCNEDNPLFAAKAYATANLLSSLALDIVHARRDFSSELVIDDVSSTHCKREYFNEHRGNCISTIVSRKFVETQGNVLTFVHHC